MTCSQIRDMLELVLTQKSVEGKLEGVDLTQEGKGSCKRNNEHLRENLRWKRFSEQGKQAFPGSGHQTPQEEEIRQLKRENDLLRQERDILKKSS